MCIQPENEVRCCNGQCNQGRDCPQRNVIDFLTFWHIRLPHINWWPLFSFALLAICGALVAAGIYGFATSIDWGHVLGAMWGAR